MQKVDDLLGTFHVADAVDAVLAVAKRANKYIDETEPWALAKDPEKQARLGTVLYNLLEAIRFLAILLSPFTPDTTEAIFAQTNMNAKDYDSLSAFGALEPGIKVGKAVPLFARIDKEEMAKRIEARQKANAEAETANNAKVKEKLDGAVAGIAQIGIEDFGKVELRVAEIINCEPIKRAKKLLKLTLNDGEGERTVASGIAPWYKPEDLVGRKIILVANLKPAKLCGVESQGMILAADNAEDDVKVIFVDDLNTGAKIR